MDLWNLYFITKLFLYFGHYINFHTWLNIAFAVFLIAPIPERFAHLSHLKLIRQIIAVPVGIALFYYDTWLPPITRVLSQASEIKGFTFTYLLELLGRFINPWVVAGLLLLYAIFFVARKKLRITSFVFLALLVPLLPFGKSHPRPSSDEAYAAQSTSGVPSNISLTDQLNSFFHDEAERSVTFSSPPKSDAPFDIIFLHICSLSWDDIDFTKQRENALFNRFDIVFSDFNSSASYSGPAAIRLLRGSCGQPSHDALFAPPQQQCLTMDNLQKIGFERQLAMNHDGHYGNFLDDVRERGRLQVAPFTASGLPPYLQSFDGSPVHNDLALLSKWWAKRVQSPTERVALYYNSISLHDGNYYPGSGGDRRQGTLESYPRRLNQFLEDMDRFFSVLQASGRKAVVVFVAEHGASVRGDRTQIAGLREIPTPKITTVPLGIKLIGVPDSPSAHPLILSEPSSYLAVSQLLANFVTLSPFGNHSLRLEDYVRDLPTTRFVSENDGVTLMRRDNQYFVHFKGQEWIEYDTSQ